MLIVWIACKHRNSNMIKYICSHPKSEFPLGKVILGSSDDVAFTSENASKVFQNHFLGVPIDKTWIIKKENSITYRQFDCYQVKEVMGCYDLLGIKIMPGFPILFIPIERFKIWAKL